MRHTLAIIELICHKNVLKTDYPLWFSQTLVKNFTTHDYL
ncbi:hypothetical protein VCHC43B1_1140 [Vibrio cholerae HC-43B1]|nr:hypothetical protein VCHE39_2007 [Vibrio cholerae HE39]EJH54070.1 hypothetical protein VCHC43B1_1140 [Vibrio cholerae HC-43B1]